LGVSNIKVGTNEGVWEDIVRIYSQKSSEFVSIIVEKHLISICRA